MDERQREILDRVLSIAEEADTPMFAMLFGDGDRWAGKTNTLQVADMIEGLCAVIAGASIDAGVTAYIVMDGDVLMSVKDGEYVKQPPR